MQQGRKKHVGLAYRQFGDDLDSEESIVWESCKRTGDFDLFYLDNPERRLIAKEEVLLDDEEEEQIYARNLCEAIQRELTSRQLQVWQLRAEGMNFEEIARQLDCSERTIYNEWKVIRDTAWKHVRSM